MKIYKIIGNVTLSRCHPSFSATRLLASEPEGPVLLGAQQDAEPDLVIVWDDCGAGLGAQVAVSDGAEAAQPFKPEMKPVDAYCSAILDQIHIEPQALRQLKLDG